MLDFKRIAANWKKRRAMASMPIGSPIQSFFNAPQPNPDNSLDDCEYLAVDIETTGLSSNKDKMLSIGFVPIKKCCIDLSQAQHFYIETQTSVGNSATIHNIKDSDISEKGLPIETAMTALLHALAGKVLLVHYAKLDYRFLNKTTQSLYGTSLTCPVIDTLEVEKKRLLREQPNQPPKLRLDDCRENYNLPRYSAHNALTDAIATAELWIAQMSILQENNPRKLKDYC